MARPTSTSGSASRSTEWTGSERSAGAPFCSQVNFPETQWKFRRFDEAPADPASEPLPPFYPDHPVVRVGIALYLDTAQHLGPGAAGAVPWKCVATPPRNRQFVGETRRTWEDPAAKGHLSRRALDGSAFPRTLPATGGWLGSRFGSRRGGAGSNADMVCSRASVDPPPCESGHSGRRGRERAASALRRGTGGW